MSHLLIDRFRFDSFAPDSDEAGSNLLTRFGQTVYLFFVITPPEQLVERAWKRGLEFGRYKAVDDTLAHAVEAYTGIPDVFFTWVRRSDKRIQFEFLDNTRAARASVRARSPSATTTRSTCWTSRACSTSIATGASTSMPPRPQLLYRGSTAAGRRAQHGIPEALRRGISRSQFRRSGERARSILRIESGVPVWVDRDGACRRRFAIPTRCSGVRCRRAGRAARRGAAAERPQYLPQRCGAPAPTLGQSGAARR